MMNRIVFTRRMLSNILCVLTMCLPIFRYYDLATTGFAMETLLTLLMFGICIVMFFAYRKSKHTVYTVVRKSQMWFGVLIFWLLMITCIYELFTNLNISHEYADYTIISLIMIVIRAVVIGYILGGNFDYEDIFKIYTVLVYMVIFVYLMQYAMVFAGIRRSFKMPFMPFSDAYTYLNKKTFFGMEPDPTSLFSERAHLSEFIVPYIAICLFGDKITKDKYHLKAILASVVVISTVSGTGVVVVMIEWILFFLGLGGKKSKYRILYLISGAIILAAAYYIIRQIPSFSEMFNELFVDNSGDSYSNTKADYRIYRGFDYFTLLPTYGQVFGIGYNHLGLFTKVHGITSEYDKSSLAFEFLSSIFQIAIYSGLIGAFAATVHIWNLFKAKSALAKALIIVMLAMWCSSAMFLNNSHIVMILLTVSAIYYDNQPSEVSV